ncbi:hypothetical protein ACNFCJ_01510 [Pseudomonas sp. NY15364]|uniref:hypothetical protein n=1 Tax=Pseudomonas sp. NY15364 TaxID=3400353 RepID=UPI003A8A91FE
MNITIVGTGYVGLSNAVLLAQHNKVIALDIVQAKVDLITQRKSPIEDAEIEHYLAEKRLDLWATLDKREARPQERVARRPVADVDLDGTTANYAPSPKSTLGLAVAGDGL